MDSEGEYSGEMSTIARVPPALRSLLASLKILYLPRRGASWHRYITVTRSKVPSSNLVLSALLLMNSGQMRVDFWFVRRELNLQAGRKGKGILRAKREESSLNIAIAVASLQPSADPSVLHSPILGPLVLGLKLGHL